MPPTRPDDGSAQVQATPHPSAPGRRSVPLHPAARASVQTLTGLEISLGPVEQPWARPLGRAVWKLPPAGTRAPCGTGRREVAVCKQPGGQV